MSEAGTGPLVRVWELTGVDVDDHAAIDAIVSNVLPRITALDGYLGGYLMADRERRVLMGVTIWADEAARDSSGQVRDALRAAVMAMTSAVSVQHWNCELLVSQPPARVHDHGASGG